MRAAVSDRPPPASAHHRVDLADWLGARARVKAPWLPAPQQLIDLRAVLYFVPVAALAQTLPPAKETRRRSRMRQVNPEKNRRGREGERAYTGQSVNSGTSTAPGTPGAPSTPPGMATGSEAQKNSMR